MHSFVIFFLNEVYLPTAEVSLCTPCKRISLIPLLFVSPSQIIKLLLYCRYISLSLCLSYCDRFPMSSFFLPPGVVVVVVEAGRKGRQW